MSVLHLASVWNDDYYTESEKTKLLVALAIADCARGEDGKAWPSIDYLARKARCTSRSVQESCRELERDGKLLIHVGAGPNGTNVYRLQTPFLVHNSTPPATISGCNGASPGCTQTVRNRKSGTVPDEAEAIYSAFPNKVGKPSALRAIAKALKTTPGPKLLELTQAFAKAREGDLEFCPHPATWFNQERYNDDPTTWKRRNGHSSATTESSRSRGTANEGVASQYAGIGKLRPKLPDPQ